MQILALCDYYDGVAVGGAEVVAREIYSRLARDSSVKITVVGALPAERWRCSRGCPEGNPRRVSVPGKDLTGVLGAQLMIAPSLWRVALRESQARMPDVVHINGLHFHSTGVGIRLAKKLSLPAVSTAHLADVGAMPGVTRLAAIAFDRIWAGRAARRSDRVVAVSQSVSEHLVRLGVDPDRIDVAHNGVDLERFCPATGTAKHAELRAVIVGRLTSNKGPYMRWTQSRPPGRPAGTSAWSWSATGLSRLGSAVAPTTRTWPGRSALSAGSRMSNIGWPMRTSLSGLRTPKDSRWRSSSRWHAAPRSYVPTSLARWK